jgi:histidinol-phosphate aminotransferase
MLKSLRDLGHDVPNAQGNFLWLPSVGHTHRWTNAFVDAGVMVRPYAADAPGAPSPFDGIRITIGEPAANDLALEIAARLN